MSFILKILSLLLVAPIVFFLRPVLYKRHGKRWFYLFIVLHALLLTLVSITVLNLPVTFLSDEISFLNGSHYFLSNFKKEKAYEFVRNNFVLINNSFDKQLLTNPLETQGDSTYIDITDRRKLIKLFHILNSNPSNVDVVVCDISFNDTTQYDRELCKEMWELTKKKKLIVSISGEDKQKGIFHIPDNIKGDVKEETNTKMFLSHRLKRDKYYSLPYRVYSNSHGIKYTMSCFFNNFLKEHVVGKEDRWVMNVFLPRFFITNESLFENNLIEVNSNELSKENNIYSIESSSRLLRNLGVSIKYDGEDLLDDLAQRKKSKKKNIVLLGTFSGDEDLHKTAFEDLHGPVICNSQNLI